MESNNKKGELKTMDTLAATIQTANSFFLDKVHRQFNTALTLRNFCGHCPQNLIVLPYTDISRTILYRI